MSYELVSLTRPQHGQDVSAFGYEKAKEAQAFHRSFPGYEATPLISLSHLAQALGVQSIHVKDESKRFGLNAFKGLGGSFCIGTYIAQKLGIPLPELPYDRLISQEIADKLGKLTFVTATDGNHGRGIAWTAKQLHQNCVVYMPKGSAPERLHNIQALGANAEITALSYDDAVRFASEQAEKNGWVLVQDTDWEGYTEIPGHIMQGYTTMAYEIVQQLAGIRPTHIFLQAGVGAMSGAMTGFFADYYGDGPDAPIVTIVEPEKANCIYATAKANDGQLHPVTTEMDTIMAGLACGVPCTTGWRILHDHADHFASVPDATAADGMRVLGNPLPGDTAVISGESGAATTGFVYDVLSKDSLQAMKQQLGLTADSRILCISTEGDTDKGNYRRIVWEGKYPSL